MAITKLQPFNLDTTANYTFANITATNANLGNNVTANFFTGNGSLLTDISTTSISNGNSNVRIATSNGNINLTAVGNTIMVITGTGANIAGTLNVTGNITPGGAIITRIVSIADGTSVTMNGNTTDLATQTNTQTAGTLTINAVSGTLFNGQKIMFRLQSANVQTFSWDSSFAGSTDLSLPTVSSGSNKYDYMGFIYNTTASKWQLLAKNFGF